MTLNEKCERKGLLGYFHFGNLCPCANLFFFIRVFFHEHSRTTGPQGKGKGISLTPHYHFRPLHRHLDISLGGCCRELTSTPLQTCFRSFLEPTFLLLQNIIYTNGQVWILYQGVFDVSKKGQSWGLFFRVRNVI